MKWRRGRGFEPTEPHQVDLFLDVPSLERWRQQRELAFPGTCCVCSRPATRELPAHGPPRWLGLLRGERLLERVPHCEAHGPWDEASLQVDVFRWTEQVVQFLLSGPNEAFLSETARLNQEGPVAPPWRAFPHYSSYTSAWRQGYGEYWLLHAWLPFWERLSEAERERYLEEWDIPEEWRDWGVIGRLKRSR